MSDPALILAAAFLVDLTIGDPVYRLHPVRLIGHLASYLERRFFHLSLTGYVGGGVFFVAMVMITTSSYVALHTALQLANEWLVTVLDVFVLYASFALKDQYHHAEPIRRALLAGDIASARESVQRIVGRDASKLDAHGVARAAVESIAESFVDGFFAPLFWFFTAEVGARAMALEASGIGVAAAVVYRTVNTLDSMVGYRNARYQRFGCCSAIADDALGFLPARLSIPVLFFAALFRGLAPAAGLNAWRRDRSKTPSPNAGQAESFVAGALGVRLGGPVTYPFGDIPKPWLGTGTRHASPMHIQSCWKLVQMAGLCATGGLATLLILC